MQSHIKLQLGALGTPTPDIAPEETISSMLLRTATAEILVLQGGALIVQTISNYFAHIELFECNFMKTTFIDFVVTESSCFMQADRTNNSCYLCYRPKGKYRKKILPGPNQMMVITFKSDWLIYKCKQLPEFRLFTTSFSNSADKAIRLATVGIAESLYKSLQRMDAATSESNINNDGYFFINNCINNYYNKLKGRNATLQFHHNQADEISSFISINFATDLVDDMPELARRFMVSERNLARLANIAFGIPLREQVIKLRMGYARHLLSTTSKRIKDVAPLCGYKDPYYFSKAFKKYYGKSPKLATALPLSYAPLS